MSVSSSDSPPDPSKADIEKGDETWVPKAPSALARYWSRGMRTRGEDFGGHTRRRAFCPKDELGTRLSGGQGRNRHTCGRSGDFTRPPRGPERRRMCSPGDWRSAPPRSTPSRCERTSSQARGPSPERRLSRRSVGPQKAQGCFVLGYRGRKRMPIVRQAPWRGKVKVLIVVDVVHLSEHVWTLHRPCSAKPTEKPNLGRGADCSSGSGVKAVNRSHGPIGGT